MLSLLRLPAAMLAIAAALCAGSAAAQDGWIVTEEWVVVEEAGAASRYVSPLHERAEATALASYGPFRVIDAQTAALVDITRASAPQAFAAMLEAYPAIATLEFVEAPGTYDDRANLRLGRMIRAAGLATRVSEGGSVRSGAVELFLAGTTREIAPQAEFAVHGWLDDWGRGAGDYPKGAPEHRRYLDYYTEMGMEESAAQTFYAMTNSVPFEQARWMTGGEMLGWIADMPQEVRQADADAPAGAEQDESDPALAYHGRPYLDPPYLDPPYLDLDLSLQ